MSSMSTWDLAAPVPPLPPPASPASPKTQEATASSAEAQSSPFFPAAAPKPEGEIAAADDDERPALESRASRVGDADDVHAEKLKVKPEELFVACADGEGGNGRSESREFSKGGSSMERGRSNAAAPSSAEGKGETGTDATPETGADAGDPLASVDLENLLAELTRYKATRPGEGRCVVPRSDPTFGRIMDLVVSSGAERGATERWNDRFEVLEAFVRENGHCSVPLSHDGLGAWIVDQRKHYKMLRDGKPSPLTAERIGALDALEFSWNFNPRGWDMHFCELKAFRDEHGHTKVPYNYPRLGMWVKYLRQQYRKRMEERHNNMTDERLRLLNDLGFVWSRNKRDMWGDRLDELRVYKVERGHCNVPQMQDGKRSGLGNWVHHQRTSYRKWKDGRPGPMTRRKFEALHTMGFSWTCKSPSSEAEAVMGGNSDDDHRLVGGSGGGGDEHLAGDCVDAGVGDPGVGITRNDDAHPDHHHHPRVVEMEGGPGPGVVEDALEDDDGSMGQYTQDASHIWD